MTFDEWMETPADDIDSHGSTIDRMRAAWNRATEEEREACAKVCDDIAADRWALYKGRPPYIGREDGRACQQTQGENIGAENCAAAIRARSN